MWFRLTLQVGGHNAPSCLALGTICQKRGQMAKALRYYRKSLRHNPDNWKAYWNLSLLHEERGNSQRAREAIEQVIRLRPDMEQAGERLRTLDSKSGRQDGDS